MITPDVSEFVEMSQYVEDGAWPILAGARQQANVFMQARQYYRERLAEARDEVRNHPEFYANG